jgi:hypothetical protein
MPQQENSPQINPVESQDAAVLVDGPRQVGTYKLPSGGFVDHMVTRDGMKQSVVIGSPYRSAAEFHVANGVGTEGEKQKVEAARQRAEDLKDAPVIDPQQ